MYNDAVQTALNVLSMIEEEAPDESRRLRRLLPALAISFARAGHNLSERKMLEMVRHATEENIPLQALFRESQRGNEPTSYHDALFYIGSPAPKALTLERALEMGRVDIVRRLCAKEPISKEKWDLYLTNAASRGQVELATFLVGRVERPLRAISDAIGTAARQEQYHLVLHMMTDGTNLSSALNEEILNRVFDEEGLEGFAAFEKLYRDYQKSDPLVLPEYFTGLESLSNYRPRMQPYLEIRKMCSNELSNIRELNLISAKAALLFQSPQNVLRFLEKWGKPSERPLQELFKNAKPPMSGDADWAMWGDALMKYGPQMFFPLQHACLLGSPARNAEGKISLRATRERIWHLYPKEGEAGDVAALCYEHQTGPKVLEESIHLWSNRAKDEPESRFSIPDIKMDGRIFGLDGYRLEKLAHNDPRTLFLGYYTGCCEKMGDHFEETVRHAVSTRESGYYVLMNGNDIRAHSWVWRGEGGQIIIDGWESADKNVTAPILNDLTDEIAHELAKPVYEAFGISDVLLGPCSDDFLCEMDFPIAKETARRFACEWYFFEPNQWLVKRIRMPSAFEEYNPNF